MRNRHPSACWRTGGKVVEKTEILFARLDPKEVMAKVEAMHEARRAADGSQNGAQMLPAAGTLWIVLKRMAAQRMMR